MATYMLNLLSGPSSWPADVKNYGRSVAGSAVNRNGDVAGGAYQQTLPSGDTRDVGMVWEYGLKPFTMPLSDSSPFAPSTLADINGNGVAVGWRLGGDFGPVAGLARALAVQSGVITDLGALIAPSLATMATCINDGLNDSLNDDLLIGGIIIDPSSGPDNYSYAYVYNWKKNTLRKLVGTVYQWPRAINQQGDCVISDVDLSADRGGFVYSYSTDNLRPITSAALVNDINDKGVACGSIASGATTVDAYGIPMTAYNYLPGMWDTTQATPPSGQPWPTFVPIPLPTEEEFIGGHALGINNKGQVVGTCWTQVTYETTQQVAFIYDPISNSSHPSHPLSNFIAPGSGVSLCFAADINDAGQITGGCYVGGDPQGDIAAFLLDPIASPPTFDGILPLIMPQLVGPLAFDGPGFKRRADGTIVPYNPWGDPLGYMPSAKRDVLIGLALEELAGHLEDAEARAAIRQSSLEMVRRQVDRLLATPAVARAAMPRAETVDTRSGAGTSALRFKSGLPPFLLPRVGRQFQQP